MAAKIGASQSNLVYLAGFSAGKLDVAQSAIAQEFLLLLKNSAYMFKYSSPINVAGISQLHKLKDRNQILSKLSSLFFDDPDVLGNVVGCDQWTIAKLISYERIEPLLDTGTFRYTLLIYSDPLAFDGFRDGADSNFHTHHTFILPIAE